MADAPSFTVHADDQTGEHLVAGFAGPGVAGPTVVDYPVEALDTAQVGHVATGNLPDLTPFSEGRPRRPVRLHDVAGAGVTVPIFSSVQQ